MTMRLLSVCLLLLLWSWMSCPAESRRLHVGSCPVSIHTHELRRHYADLRDGALSEDTEMGVRLLKGQVMKDIKDGDSCCFLRLLLRFYVERVFSSYRAAQPQQQRSSSALANSFISIKKDLRLCHCECREETQRRMDTLHAEFLALDVQQAALKAVGELGTLLDWLDRFTAHRQR